MRNQGRRAVQTVFLWLRVGYIFDCAKFHGVGLRVRSEAGAKMKKCHDCFPILLSSQVLSGSKYTWQMFSSWRKSNIELLDITISGIWPKILPYWVNEWVWMGEWMDERTNDRTHEWVNDIDRSIDCMNECIHAWKDGWMNEWMNKWMNEWVD